MSSAGVTARLHEVGRLLRVRGFVRKGVDMGAAAVTGRLKTQGALSDMCRRLGVVGRRLENHAENPVANRACGPGSL